MTRWRLPRLILGAWALPLLSGFAQAQQFPNRPVTLIVPFAAGGTTDVGLRALAAATEKHLGQSIVVENRGGAGGVLGPMQMAAGSAPDGHTIAQFRSPCSAIRTLETPRSIRSAISATPKIIAPSWFGPWQNKSNLWRSWDVTGVRSEME